MPNATSKPDTFNKLRAGANAAFAMAGIQLDVFTPLKAGSMTAEQLAAAMGVGSTRLCPLLYALAVAGLLTERDGQFSNTAEANQFLVKGEPSYIGDRHGAIANSFAVLLKTAESIRSGSQRRSWISPILHQRSWNAFFEILIPAQLQPPVPYWTW